MRRRDRRVGTTLLVLPARPVAVDELFDLVARDPARGLLEASGIVAEPGSAADLSTALTRVRTERIAGHPGATLTVSGDRESGYVYLRLLGSAALAQRAAGVFDELELRLRARLPGLRTRRRR